MTSFDIYIYIYIHTHTHTHTSHDQCPLWLISILYGIVQDVHKYSRGKCFGYVIKPPAVCAWGLGVN